MNFVNVGLLGRELDIVSDLVANGAKQLIIDKVVDDGMLVGCGLCVLVGVGLVNLFVKKTISEASLGLVG